MGIGSSTLSSYLKQRSLLLLRFWGWRSMLVLHSGSLPSTWWERATPALHPLSMLQTLRRKLRTWLHAAAAPTGNTQTSDSFIQISLKLLIDFIQWNGSFVWRISLSAQRVRKKGMIMLEETEFWTSLNIKLSKSSKYVLRIKTRLKQPVI